MISIRPFLARLRLFMLQNRSLYAVDLSFWSTWMFQQIDPKAFFTCEPRVIVSHPVVRNRTRMHWLNCYVCWRTRSLCLAIRASKCQQPMARLLLTRWRAIAARNPDVPKGFWKILLYIDTDLVCNDFSASHQDCAVSCSPLKCCFMTQIRISHVIES